MTRNKHTYTSFFTANTFFRTLHIIKTHSQHLCRETRPRLSVLDAQIKACRSTKTKQRSGGLGQKNGMVPFTSLLQTSFLHVPLCLLYPYYPRAFPNLYYFPSNSSPPQASLSPQTQLPNRTEKVWESLPRAFLFQFSSVFISCNVLSFHRRHFYNKTS